MALPFSPSFARMWSGCEVMMISLRSAFTTVTASVSTLSPRESVRTHLYCWPRRLCRTCTLIVAVFAPGIPETCHSVPPAALKYHW